MQKCENVSRNLVEFVNAERSKKCVLNFGSFLPKDARVNLVDIVKSFSNEIAIQTSINFSIFTCKNRRPYSRERASQNLPKISPKLKEKPAPKVRKT